MAASIFGAGVEIPLNNVGVISMALILGLLMMGTSWTVIWPVELTGKTLSMALKAPPAAETMSKLEVTVEPLMTILKDRELG